MWNAHTESLTSNVSNTRLLENDTTLSHGRVLELLEKDASFRAHITRVITVSPFEAFFWETPAVTSASLKQPFEFVLVESNSLMRLRPDPSPFAEHFAKKTAQTVLAFSNLGGDATLIVPKPVYSEANYTHLARFLRHAPGEQVDEFWLRAAQTLREQVASSPIWLSTAGLGVSWLHLRLDSRPKYYRHAPYQTTR